MSDDTIHPVIELLVKRMESHPTEFDFTTHPGGHIQFAGRWDNFIGRLGHYMTEAERNLIYAAKRKAVFEKVHEEIVDELFNGDDRRAKQEQERADRAGQTFMQQQMYAQSQLQGQLGQLGQLQPHTLNSYLNAANVAPQTTYNSATNAYSYAGQTFTSEAAADSGLLDRIRKGLLGQ